MESAETESRPRSYRVIQELILDKTIVSLDLHALQFAIGSKMVLQMPLMC